MLFTSVSMPPRRSCFAGRSGEASGVFFGFQCHHGVPASRAARASGEIWMRFQCHHGVPASTTFHRSPYCLFFVSMPPRRSCFLKDAHNYIVLTALVSMPPRRSCFPIIPQGGGLLSSPGRDIEGDGDRWVRTSVGFDGSFAPSPSIPPSEVRGSLFRTLDHLPIPQPRRVVFLKTNGSKSESSVAPRCVIGFLFRGPPIAGFPMGVRG